MGYAKRMLMEDQARIYHTSSDAVCGDCFNDPGLTAFIEERLEADTCSVCGRSAKNIAAPADDVLQFFLEKVQEEYEDAANSAPWDGEEGKFAVETYSMLDIVFSEHPDIAPFETLEWLYSRLKDDVVYCDRDWQILTPAQALKHSWDSFANSVKHTTRFLFFPRSAEKEQSGEPYLVRPEQMLEELGSVIQGCGLIRRIPAGTRLFRARGHEIGTTYSQPKDLGPPPVAFARTAGRMNAPGIVVFYGAYNKNTALAEAMGKHRTVSMAEFETLAELPVVDLTNLPPVPSIFEGGQRESLRFLRQFTHEVSQPFEPDAEIHIEYTPTQVVAEYFRHRLRDANGKPIRGVAYESAKCPGSANVALFTESSEVEGVPTDSWRKKEPVLRLIAVEEITAPGS